MLPTDPADLETLAVFAATRFVLNDEGRMVCSRDSARTPSPRVALFGSASGNLVLFGRDVPRAVAHSIADLAATEPPFILPEMEPRHAAAYRSAVAGEGLSVESGSYGNLHYLFPQVLQHRHDAALIRSGTRQGDAFLAALPRGNQFGGWPHPVPGHIAGPWCMAMEGDAIAAIVETVRLSDDGAECGVTTAPAFRGRGFASASVAGWAAHPDLAGRMLFYSTQRPNLSSQRVTERLGLRYLGSSWTAG